MDLRWLEWTDVDLNGLALTWMDWRWLEWTGVYLNGLALAWMDWRWLEWTNVDLNGLALTWMDLLWLEWTGVGLMDWRWLDGLALTWMDWRWLDGLALTWMDWSWLDGLALTWMDWRWLEWTGVSLKLWSNADASPYRSVQVLTLIQLTGFNSLLVWPLIYILQCSDLHSNLYYWARWKSMHASVQVDISWWSNKTQVEHEPWGVGYSPYIGYTGMCRWKGYGFQAIWSGIGSSNHRKLIQ